MRLSRGHKQSDEMGILSFNVCQNARLRERAAHIESIAHASPRERAIRI